MPAIKRFLTNWWVLAVGATLLATLVISLDVSLRSMERVFLENLSTVHREMRANRNCSL